MKKLLAVLIFATLLAQLSLGDESVEADVFTGFSVEEWVSTTLLYSHNDTLIWRKMFPGEYNLSADNNITLRIEMETNVNSDVYVAGDDFQCVTPAKCSGWSFHISNLSICNTSLINDTNCEPWDVQNNFGPSGGYYENVPAPSGSPISKVFTFFLSTPGAQRAGGYQANFTLKTIKSGESP